jgi:hypothetical protein
MKKLLFGLIATVLFSFIGNAQNITKEEARYKLAEGMIPFVDGVKPAYKTGQSYTNFEKTILGSWRNTTEGTALLRKAYDYVLKGTTKDEILKLYSGLEMANALALLEKIKAKNPRTDGAELFGGTTGDFNPYGNTSSQLAAKCRWYQIGCHLQALLDFINANTIPICFVLELFNIPCPPKP